ncbi:PREDICTED: uncharacterized protein LOC105457516 isoform X2 [Wasmannia auropunctata]|uniref:uncharacterized protein LOC105457516 isoform X2 n=1 Tax=Wasmannia auropunctata TaxID=64793 RepID=UPI0005F0B598|nr:PREDICTED: uncharacterized protein LOC105457516 isoform X2 [Wasmannia auropunctata]
MYETFEDEFQGQFLADQEDLDPSHDLHDVNLTHNDFLLDITTDKENEDIQDSLNNSGFTDVQSEAYSSEKIFEQSEPSNSFAENISDEMIANSGSSTMEVQLETAHDADEASELSEMPDSSGECVSVETIDDSRPFAMKVQPEICHGADKASKLKEVRSMLECLNAEFSDSEQAESSTMELHAEEQHEVRNSSKKCKRTVIIDLSESSTNGSFNTDGNSNNDNNSNTDSNSSDNSFNNNDDISIIGTVKKSNNPVPSCSSLDRLELNQVETAPTGSHKQATIVNNKVQGGRNEKAAEENNNDVLYIKNVSKKEEKRRELSSPEPGCSKDSSDDIPEAEDSSGSSNLDELLKDAKLIHVLLPRYNSRTIYKAICNNQNARNRIELTLWDLLPEERPLPQYLQKRKCSSDTYCTERKRNRNTAPQKDQVENAALVKREERARDEATADNEKSVIEELASLMDENETKMDIPEAAPALNDANNDIAQQDEQPTLEQGESEQPTLKEITFRLLEDLGKYCAENYVAPNPKTSMEVDSNVKPSQLQATTSSEARVNLLSDNKSRLLQPAKFTPQGNSTPKNERLPKSTNPLLSPPKLQVHGARVIPAMPQGNVTSTNYAGDMANTTPGVTQMRQNEQIVFPMPTTSYTRMVQQSLCPQPFQPSHPPSPILQNLNPNSFVRNHTLLPSNDKKASTRVPRPPPLQWHRSIKYKLPPRIREMESTKLDNAHVARASVSSVSAASGNHAPVIIPSSSKAAAVQNISDHQRASGSNANCNFEKGGNMNTSQALHEHESGTRGMESNYINIIDDSSILNIKKVKIDSMKDAAQNEIKLSEKATKIYAKLIPMFPTVKTRYIKRLCHEYVNDDEVISTQHEAALVEYLVERLLQCDQENLSVTVKKDKPLPEATNSIPTYDMNEQYADLLMIFPEADPVYLREVAEQIYSDPEQIKEFVQSKLENPDYPTRTQYLAKKKKTQQQKQYTTDFKVEQFLSIFPDPFSYFEDDKRICEFNPHAVDFLKYYFSKLRVNTLVKAYSEYKNNLSLTAKSLEALNPDMKTRRHSNKMTLTEDIPFLQECAFIQHKAEIKNYLNEVKLKEEQEFNELKAKNELLECQCCYDDECMPSKCSTCEDGHVFCNTCIIRSTDVVLGDGNTRIDCLIQCGCEFPISVLQRVLLPTKFSILLCKRQEAEIMAAGLEGLVSCPFCHFASIPPPEDKIFKCLNPECMKETCRFCKELNHVPLKCNERKATESARLFLEEKMTEALVRKCYRCSKMFFKEEGCNKMTCTCGAQMCYICDKPVTDYRHFQGQGAECSNLCPLWSDDRRMNAENVIKVCQATMKQIKEKDPQININVDKLLPVLPPKSRGPHENIQNGMRLVQCIRCWKCFVDHPFVPIGLAERFEIFTALRWTAVGGRTKRKTKIESIRHARAGHRERGAINFVCEPDNYKKVQ